MAFAEADGLVATRPHPRTRVGPSYIVEFVTTTDPQQSRAWRYTEYGQSPWLDNLTRPYPARRWSRGNGGRRGSVG
ncbi:hypothetical protein AB4305_17285 [Nocardia sp. 2YAB30]|uniref:hypothetical protein n=1 Tax=unclassified Nocardia TaxID=2637762 RepID=UPI003F9CCA3E